jgi:hypothetical protein
MNYFCGAKRKKMARRRKNIGFSGEDSDPGLLNL